MALNRYEGGDKIELGRVAPATGLRAVADSWGDVGRTASQINQVAYREGLEQAQSAGEQEGEKAVWTDPETGKPQIVGTLPEGTRPYAVAYRKAAEARYQAELGLSSFTKAAELANANAGNPEGFRNAWAGYIKGVSESVPESIRPGVDLLLKEQGVKHYYQMQQEDFRRTQSEAKVGTLNLVDAFERDAVDTLRSSGLAGGSPEFMSSKIGNVEALLRDQVRAGVITPEESKNRLQDFKMRLVRGTISGEAIKMAKEGKVAEVDKFLDEFKRSKSDLVDDYQRDQIANFARGEVATEIASAKATQAAVQDAAKKQLTENYINVSWKGENPAMDDAQALRIAQATGNAELIADTQAAMTARTTMKEFSLLPPQAQQTALEDARNQPQTGDTLKLKENLESIYKQTQTAMDSKETLQLASNRGVIQVDPIDPANPASMQKRAVDVSRADQYLGVDSNPLLPPEKEQFIKLFDGLDSEGKIAFYNSMQKDMGQDIALRAMRQLGQQRPAMALAMAISDDAPEVARSVLMGDLALQADKTLLPDGMNFEQDFRDHVGTSLQGDDTLRNAVYQSSLAVWADQTKRGKSDDFTAAIDTVTGGIVEYNGFKTIAPQRGMDGSDFDDLIDGMDDAGFRQAAGGNKLVSLDGTEVNAGLIQSNGTFEWIGDGQYILKLNISGTLNGQTVFMADDKGQLLKDQWGRPVPAELDLKPFVGE